MNETRQENIPNETPKINPGSVKEYVRRVKRREKDLREIEVEKKLAKAKEEYKAKEPARQAAKKDPYLKIPTDALMTYEHVQGYAERVRDNDILADYYRELAEESGDTFFNNKAQSIACCAKQWFFDDYRLQRVRDLKSIFLCKDKFCLNCQTMQQAVRLSRFSPILEELTSEGKKIYHAVFTVPNVPADKLAETVEKMIKAFSMLIRYFRGDPKLSFGLHKCGYLGGVRGLEITTDNGYHAHIHCALAFDKPLFKEKAKINKYSYDYRGEKPVFARNFSEFEILMQKVWYCLMHDIPTTRENVENLRDGYSVTFDEVIGTVYEVFKYVIKFERNEDGRLKMTYEQFRTLYYALKGVHVFQGYGCFRNVAAPVLEDEVLEQYNVIIEKLRLVEDPVNMQYEPINEVMTNILAGKYRYVTRRTVDAFIRNNPEFIASLNDVKITPDASPKENENTTTELSYNALNTSQKYSFAKCLIRGKWSEIYKISAPQSLLLTHYECFINTYLYHKILLTLSTTISYCVC